MTAPVGLRVFGELEVGGGSPECCSRITRTETVALEGQWENAFSGNQLESVQDEALCSLSHESCRGQKAQSSFLAPEARTD